jgi:hypothetical protein
MGRSRRHTDRRACRDDRRGCSRSLCHRKTRTPRPERIRARSSSHGSEPVSRAGEHCERSASLASAVRRPSVEPLITVTWDCRSIVIARVAEAAASCGNGCVSRSHILRRARETKGAGGPPLQVVGWSGRHPHGRYARPEDFDLAGFVHKLSAPSRAVIVYQSPRSNATGQPTDVEQYHARGVCRATSSRFTPADLVRPPLRSRPMCLQGGQLRRRQQCSSRLRSPCLSLG